MKRVCLFVIGIALLVAGCGGSGGSSSTTSGNGGHVNIVIWHGYTQAEATAIKTLTNEFNATHPNITVTPQFYGNSDYALQKVLAAIAGGKPPDISYLYGSWAANIATNPGTVNLTPYVSQSSFGWSDFWPAERNVATVNGKVIGVPALVDNLALVYNKRLFAQAGLAPPTPSWTWSDFENAAIKLTNPAKKQFGWAYVNDASEDTVWRYWALLWQAGGSILTPDGKHAAFDSPAGVKALTFLQTLAQHHAIYFDNGSGNYLGLFTSGHIGMLYTGPWDLGQITAGNQPYGVQILPGDQNHQTISGPDNWVVFNNGAARVKAAVEFLKWFTSPAIDLKWCLMTGDLPIRAAVAKLPGYKQFIQKYPGVGTWVENLNNATQSRPVTTTYPKISTVIGQMVQSVLLGKAQPQQALSSAAQQVNGILAAPS
ncbi:MAG TPA: ABC transporter substrate-binding protein [Solirubrobacteraceae bacterium]|nr:ABC transporter substrate-binding protein [Solirubrobacteraceae bacterium]